MRPQSLALTLMLCLGATAASATGLPPASAKTEKAYKEERRRPADCHRDVRTHRIGGVMITHRHVGDRCQVRQVRKLNSF